MQFGKLTNEQLLNPKIRTCYNDIIRKTRYIAYKVDIINDIRKDLLAKMPDISETDKIILCGEISDCFEKMYSCMEYASIILKEVLRDRGNLKSKFHEILKKTLENSDPLSIYADTRIVSFIRRALDWYSVVHDIRSEETHFSMARIEVVDSKIFYKIRRQTSRETVSDLIHRIKKHLERQDTEYILEIGDVIKLYIGFVDSIRQLETIILSKTN
ncbi:hypothetical protein [Ruminiclostridium josui]|uniref:hypothetical protein n=1 Tax=Ruminiclostridium josui TaxID=1499 RepID=UPI000464F3E5|nr:hypothetical protein [Ruminiclostridium josui]